MLIDLNSAAMTSLFRAVHIPALYSEDYTYNETELFIWTAAELATTIIAASITVLRALLRDIVHSPLRTGGNTGVVNTFKSGTYMCSTISRSQNYRRMDGGIAHIQKQKSASNNGYLAGISESESVISLGLTTEESFGKNQYCMGILKTEEIEVVYDNPGKQS